MRLCPLTVMVSLQPYLVLGGEVEGDLGELLLRHAISLLPSWSSDTASNAFLRIYLLYAIPILSSYVLSLSLNDWFNPFYS